VPWALVVEVTLPLPLLVSQSSVISAFDTSGAEQMQT
jgi:hypothetical protein